ncbi:MAG: hypothetical protein AABX37_05320, partial [Nanoarchaeota archaeon]
MKRTMIAVFLMVLMLSLPLVLANLPKLEGATAGGAAPQPTAGTINLGNGRIPQSQVSNFFDFGSRTSCVSG